MREIEVLEEKELIKVDGEILEFNTLITKCRPISSALDLDVASNWLKGVKTLIKAIEEKRGSFVDPLNAVVKKINDAFRPRKAKAEAIKETLENSIREYHLRLERIAREEREAKDRELRRLEQEKAKALAEAVAQNDDKKLEEAIAVERQEQTVVNNYTDKTPEATTKSSTGVSTNVRDNWLGDVVNALEVPRELCSPDPKLIKRAVDSGVRLIPGVRIYNKPIVSSR